MGIKVCSMKGHALFQEEISTNECKYSISTKLGTKAPFGEGDSWFKKYGSFSYRKGDDRFSSPIQRSDIIILCLLI